MTVIDLERTYLGFDERGRITKLPVGPDFWETIDKSPASRGILVSQFVSDVDWENWEMHPKGDEVVYLLDGEVTLILESEGRTDEVRLTSGQAIVVPARVWHRALVHVPSRMLFMTYGEGTMHRNV